MFRPVQQPVRPATGGEQPAVGSTSPWMWTVLYLATLAMAAFALPRKIEEASATLSPEMRRDIGSEELADAAVTVGASLGLLLLAIALLLVVLLLRHYERNLVGARALLPATRLAMGPCWVAAAIGRVTDTTLSGGVISPATLAALAITTTVTCGVFVGRTSRPERYRTMLAVAVSSVLSVLM